LTTSPEAIPLADARVKGDERLARRDANAHLEPLAPLGERVADSERGADGALGVVLMRRRRPEQRHHRVADELLDRAAVALELLAQPRVVGGKHRAHVLRVEPLSAAGEADQVDEEDGHDLALLSRPALKQQRPAVTAEAEAVRARLPAGQTRRHTRSLPS
jgi:hypothetical protein